VAKQPINSGVITHKWEEEEEEKKKVQSTTVSHELRL